MATRKRVTDMIVKAYGDRYGLTHKPLPPQTFSQRALDLWREIAPVLERSRFKILGASAGLILLAAAVYYFNVLIAAEHRMLKSAAQVEVLMQRRNDLSINLAKAVLDYSQYERQVFAEVVKLRSVFGQDDARGKKLDELLKAGRKPGAAATPPGGAPSASSAAGPQAAGAATAAGALASEPSLAGILAVAEQYPDLKLSANFQNLMNAIVEVEKDLAGERLKYNESVMGYLEYTASVPSNFFAALFGFKDVPYFKATPEAQTLKPIGY